MVDKLDPSSVSTAPVHLPNGLLLGPMSVAEFFERT
jgi:hypothetical protein